MTEGAAHADDAARRRIAEDLGATLFVEAGAGTGKTTALVGRVLGLVRAGQAEPRQIAAITFTEAAAAQLRDRVRVALEQAAADPALPDDERARCQTGLRQLDEAAILTLHGFAQLLLAEHPLEAGLPPEFEVLDELRAAEVFEEAWRTLLDDLLGDPVLGTAIEICLALGMSLVRLEQLALQLVAEPDRAAAAPISTESDQDLERRLGALTDGLDGLSAMASWCVRPDELLDHLRGLERLRHRLARADRVHVLRLLQQTSLRCHRGRKQDWDGRSGEVKERLVELDELRAAYLLGHGRRALAPLLERMARWAEEEAARRRRQGTLTFHDLLIGARRLLMERPGVRTLAAQRWSHLLIDEFQDTDPLQIEIALALKGDGPPEAAWTARQVPDGSLFFVGDPKQSVYRFRRADIAVYEAARERFGAGHVRLSASFRTVPGAVEWVNAAFGPLLDGKDGQAPFHPLEPVRAPLPGDHPPVRVLGGPTEAPTAEALRAREADAVARAIVAARAEEWPVASRDGGTRPLSHADIAILLPARTALAAIERALEDHGVPYRVEASSLVYESQEVRELIALLRAVDDPTDQLAVVAALRGPAFACTDPDLARWTATHHGWDYRSAMAEDGHEDAGDVAAAMTALRKLHDARRRLDPAALLDNLVRERRLFAIALARPRPRDSWRRLRFLLDESRAFAETGGTLRELVRRLERQADDQVRVTEQVLPDEDDDAVRILTVHAAKGLEFPMAILAGMSAHGRAGSGGPALWDADGAPAVRLGDALETEGYADAKTDNDLAEERERVRLLYVAATRARDHLILALHHVPAKSGRPTSAELLWQACQSATGTSTEWDPPASQVRRAANHVPRIGPAPDVAAWEAARELALRTRATAPVVSATALAAAPATAGPTMPRGTAPPADTPAAEVTDPDADAVRADDDTDDGLPDLPPFRRGRAGTAIGRAVHATLQTVDLPAATRLGDTARAQAEAEGLPERVAEIEALSRSALGSEPVREALSSGRWWREVAVVASVEGALLEGYLDLLYEDADGRLVVVDYKTDRLPADGDGPGPNLDRYRTQLGAYALAVSATLGRPVDRAALVFLTPGEARTLWIADVDAAADEARRRLRTRFAGAAAARPPG